MYDSGQWSGQQRSCGRDVTSMAVATVEEQENIEDSQREEDATGLVIVVAAGFRFLFFLLKWFSRVNRGAPTDSHYLYLSPILIGLFQYLTPTLSK